LGVALRLARDIRLLTQWLSHDVLALAGPVLATRFRQHSRQSHRNEQF
jgi:hypothetical protein